eukprot:TRINITY_DN4260_c0_g2_i4.p1 TRINITY_DN4260_c0_g2~~TRINITY_DN4260_c0_g2_i4.p1  ORF type:complete len:212 (+),score=-9.81 TRINITY_DN4260_c0_g2_i4:58-693(+)
MLKICVQNKAKQPLIQKKKSLEPPQYKYHKPNKFSDKSNSTTTQQNKRQIKIDLDKIKKTTKCCYVQNKHTYTTERYNRQIYLYRCIRQIRQYLCKPNMHGYFIIYACIQTDSISNQMPLLSSSCQNKMHLRCYNKHAKMQFIMPEFFKYQEKLNCKYMCQKIYSVFSFSLEKFLIYYYSLTQQKQYQLFTIQKINKQIWRFVPLKKCIVW